jgi:hypothetical protein
MIAFQTLLLYGNQYKIVTILISSHVERHGTRLFPCPQPCRRCRHSSAASEETYECRGCEGFCSGADNRRLWTRQVRVTNNSSTPTSSTNNTLQWTQHSSPARRCPSLRQNHLCRPQRAPPTVPPPHISNHPIRVPRLLLRPDQRVCQFHGLLRPLLDRPGHHGLHRRPEELQRDGIIF